MASYTVELFVTASLNFREQKFVVIARNKLIGEEDFLTISSV